MKLRQAMETTIENDGTRVHVALHAYEWLLWSSLWRNPELNMMSPPTGDRVTYRSVRRTADGGTEVETYTPTQCTHVHSDALHLASSSLYARPLDLLRERTQWDAIQLFRVNGSKHANAQSLERLEKKTWRFIQPLWQQTRTMRTPAEIDVELGDVEMPGVGRLSASRKVLVGGKGDTQHDWVVGQLNRPAAAAASGTWPELRQGDCEKLDFFGYCRCRVPCGQRWVLIGEPDARRQRREETAFAEYDDPWRKHGVMGTDDEEIMSKLDVAFAMEEESDRLRKAGVRNYKVRHSELNALTREITELRAKDFYGAASESALGKKVTQNQRHKYLHDTGVRRMVRVVPRD